MSRVTKVQAANGDTQELNRFPDVATAVFWMVGIRCMSGTERPGHLRSLDLRLIDDGWAVMLRIQTAWGGTSCIAELPGPLTDDDIARGGLLDLFGEGLGAFVDMPCVGSA